MWLLFVDGLSLLMSRMSTRSHHPGSLPDGVVCRLHHSLYGPKQTPRAWFERFPSIVIVAGFW